MDHCQEYLELISAAVDGALSPDQAAALEAHLAHCPACKALYEELTDLHHTLSSLPAPQPPAELKDRILAAVAAEAEAEEKVIPLPVKLVSPWKGWAASAAAIALVLVGAWSISRADGHAKIAAMAPRSADFVTVDAPEEIPETAEADLAESLPQASLFAAAPAQVNGLPDNASSATGGVAVQTSPEEVPTKDSEAAYAPYPDSVSETLPASAEKEALSALPTYDGPLTPAQALDRLLEELEFTGYDPIEADAETVYCRREDGTPDYISYTGLSDNGRYYLFEDCRTVWHGEESYLSQWRVIAVPLDGGDILTDDAAETFWAQMEQ